MKDKEKIKNKIFYLIDFAIDQKNKNNPYITEYIKIAIDLAKSINFRLPPEIHLKVCKNCYSLRGSENTLIRTETRKVNKKYQKYLKLHCLYCGNIKKINLSKLQGQEKNNLKNNSFLLNNPSKVHNIQRKNI
ncbi:MAG TPA: hypothetical protein PKK56_01105 [archaeon]|jgi:RNase P subunit RPR2|nr:hypothetical protein [archaeon]HRT02533.1 hypothetical protein [Candidatus Diapherotrites archaeon]